MKKIKIVVIVETIMIILFITFISFNVMRIKKIHSSQILIDEHSPNNQYVIRANLFDNVPLIGYDMSLFIQISIVDKTSNCEYTVWERYNFNNKIPNNRNYSIYWCDDYAKLVINDGKENKHIVRLYYCDIVNKIKKGDEID